MTCMACQNNSVHIIVPSKNLVSLRLPHRIIYKDIYTYTYFGMYMSWSELELLVLCLYNNSANLPSYNCKFTIQWY